MQTPRFSSITLITVLGLGLSTLTSCSDNETSATPLVVSTTGMIGDLVARIGGDRIDARTLLGPGVDPHLYKATQGDVRLLDRADLIFYNGLHLEGKMAQVLESLSETRSVVAVAESVPSALRIRAGAGEKVFDPHLWMDVSLWTQTLKVLEDSLTELLPEHGPTFQTNAEALRDEMLELDRWTEEEVQKIDVKRRVLVTAHDAFAYFGRRYSMKVMSLQGISTLDEASVRDVQSLAREIIEADVHALFVESSIPKRTMEAVRAACVDKEHQVEFGGELYTDALGPGDTDAGNYIGMIRHNVKAIVEALR